MNPDQKQRLATFDVNLSPFIQWPVVVVIPQEDGPEVETTFDMFRFKRPTRVESKDYLERASKRVEVQMKDFDESTADNLAHLSDDDIRAIPDFQIPARVKTLALNRDRKTMTAEEREARLNQIFDASAERKKWWSGWKVASLNDHDGDPLDATKAEHKDYLTTRIAGLEEAIDAAIRDIHLGARQKNSQA